MASKNTWKEISNRNRSNRFQNVTNTQGIINDLNITDGLGEENTLVIIPGTLGRSSTDDSGSTNDSGSISGFKCTGLALFQNNIINNLSSETNDGFLRITGGGLNHINNFSINANSGLKITGPIYQQYDICYNKYKNYYDTSNNFTSGNIFRAFNQAFTSNTDETTVTISGDLYVQDFSPETVPSIDNYKISNSFFTLNRNLNNIILNWDSSAFEIHTMAHNKFHQSFFYLLKSNTPILNIDISDSENKSLNVFGVDGFGDTFYENYSDQPGHIGIAGGATILNLNDTVSLTDISYHNDIYGTDRSLNVYGGTYIYDISYSFISISGEDISFNIKKKMIIYLKLIILRCFIK